MPKFSKRSQDRLNTCDPRLIEIFTEVVKTWDCSVLCGTRSEADQNKAYDEGRSKLKFPQSKHNGLPSKAVDVAPYPINWKDLGAFYMFAGYVMRTAEQMGYKVRFGGDWDGDKKTKDQSFNDLPHFEIV